MEQRIEHLSSKLYMLIYALPVLIFVVSMTIKGWGLFDLERLHDLEPLERMEREYVKPRIPIEWAFYMFMAMLFIQRAICDHRYAASCLQLPGTEWDCYVLDTSNRSELSSFLSSCDTIPAHAALSCFSLRPPSLSVYIETVGIVFPAAQLLWLFLLCV